MPKVSVVIPCFNQGIYLKDALALLSPDSEEYEIIIINDGSTNLESIEPLEQYKLQGYKVIDQPNMGLAAARNTGISNATGEYIMLLDADNKVEPSFLTQAARILDENLKIGVVYSDALYFGEKEELWKVGEFNLQHLMIENYIDACAMVRKSIFEELGGYDIEMKKIKTGWEDWEMWLRIAFAGWDFFYWPNLGFHYRVTGGSMIGGIKNSYQYRNELTSYLHNKYPSKLGHPYITQFVVNRFKPRPLFFLIKLSMITWFKNKYHKMVQENKMIKGI